jgi:hypothetical protein
MAIAFCILEHSHVLCELPCAHEFEIHLNIKPSSFFGFHLAKLKIAIATKPQ